MKEEDEELKKKSKILEMLGIEFEEVEEGEEKLKNSIIKNVEKGKEELKNNEKIKIRFKKGNYFDIVYKDEEVFIPYEENSALNENENENENTLLLDKNDENDEKYIWKGILSKANELEGKIELSQLKSNGYYKLEDTGPKYVNIHKGHLVAHAYEKYLDIPKEFFGKGNASNIRPQTMRSNCSSSEDFGQLYFENKILNYLKNNDSGSIYFEVEPIYFDKEDKIPIGNRYLAYGGKDKDNEKYKNFSNFHVFIPNYDINIIPKKDEVTYKDFYNFKIEENTENFSGIIVHKINVSEKMYKSIENEGKKEIFCLHNKNINKIKENSEVLIENSSKKQIIICKNIDEIPTEEINKYPEISEYISNYDKIPNSGKIIKIEFQ
ncbi:hypothetical protein BG261_00850 [Floricoccus tropicus]|uniref:DNA/RNA non-specific endonuclease domain-containing protein n=1 Tax=Floricoccus tropicus TaxID=1859473 RepID=A0A1E8GQE4_9LACT|nr:hypothetical protein [Floricoccus tropicus]OFI50459.1 hypothetical protein BG261_00850 [Floricoccus tropicus]